MGSGFQTTYLLFFFSIIIFFFCNGVMIAALDLKEKVSEFYWVEENGGVGESQIQKVSGDDQSDEETGVLQRSVVFEKFRLLLGLQSSRRERLRHGENGFSPAPAPMEGSANLAVSPAPAPVLPSFTHVKSHSPQYHVTPIPSHDLEFPGRKKKNAAKVRRIVIAIVVSFVATFVIFALVILAIQRLTGKWHHRSKKTMLVSSIGGGSGRFKLPNLSNSVNKVSFDPGPEFFYLNALEPIGEKQSFEPAPIFYNENPQISSLEDEISRVETINYESDDCSCSSPDKILCLDECGSSDNESFHSICNSHASNTRVSNASDLESGAASPISSPINSPKSSTVNSPEISPDCNVTALSHGTPLSSPTSPSTPDVIPLISSDLRSSPSSSPSGSEKIPSTTLSSPNDQNNSLLIPPLSSLPSSNLQSISSSSISPPSPKKLILPTSLLSSKSPPQFSALPLVSNGASPRPPGPPLPPCPPPPFLKGSNSIRPPPAPPCQLQQITLVGKDGSPLPKLKPLHWDKVRAAPDRSMVWDKIRSSSFELDEEMIESLFGYNLQNSKNEETKNKNSPPHKHVLDAKRLQNMTILSKALNATVEEISDALMRGEGLSVEQLEALVKMSPTKEEEQKLSNYPGDINELGSAEKFVKALLDIPYAFLRIEAMLYRETFEDEGVYLKKSFAMLEEACKELKSSRLFLKLLEAVLKTGNRMNVGTIRGGARAFKLDALLKLADVKGTDGKTTLLHFVVQEMIRSEGARASEISSEKDNLENKSKTVEESEEYYRILGLDLVSGLVTELCNVKKTASIDLDVLASSVSNLSDGMVKLKKLTQEDSLIGGRTEFINTMKQFLNHAEKNIKELQEDENRVISLIREITMYFHGDLSKDEANPLRIFVIVRDFLGMLDRVCKEIRTLQSHISPSSSLSFR